MPEHAYIVALLGFNIGVEIGQLVFIGFILSCFALIRRVYLATDKLGFLQTKWVRSIPVYAFGAISGYWFVERMKPCIVELK